ncbi:YdeI/OmpD-associated family protein [Algoriphagus vanfongensis]|uniref:YdeI/OmpD-associated family protein n=1 Tax=Algoriphagus vanfongensis TaxID=426371 RepID=UPI00040BAB71|nr:DUF1801 domain-containing protein [Algoriphagus vanfongensis]
MDTNPNLDFFFDKPSKWQEAYHALRQIVLKTGLKEELKWGCPCYTFQGSNVALIHGFKDYCAILFHKGALLEDVHGMLIQQTKNVQAARQIRFENLKEIQCKKEEIQSYLFQAIEVEKAGVKVELKKTTEFEMVEEFKNALEEDELLKKAFESLTPGRQRAYLLYFSQAKQSKTRLSRVEKKKPAILQGKGLND